jgi:hypothetical protein
MAFDGNHPFGVLQRNAMTAPSMPFTKLESQTIKRQQDSPLAVATSTLPPCAVSLGGTHAAFLQHFATIYALLSLNRRQPPRSL